jgi:hypothetical protein
MVLQAGNTVVQGSITILLDSEGPALLPRNVDVFLDVLRKDDLEAGTIEQNEGCDFAV